MTTDSPPNIPVPRAGNGNATFPFRRKVLNALGKSTIDIPKRRLVLKWFRSTPVTAASSATGLALTALHNQRPLW